MNYSSKDFWPRALSSILLLVIFEVLGSTLAPTLVSYEIRFFVLGIFCIYLSLHVHWGTLPIFFLILCWVHSIFSLEGWAINTFIAMTMILVMNFLKDMIQLENYISKILFYFLSLTLWDLLRVIILGVKVNNFGETFNMLLFDISGNAILAIFSPLITSLLALIWLQKKPLET